MGSLHIMNSKKVKQLITYVRDQWGYEMPREYVFLLNSKGRVYCIHRDMERVVDRLTRIDSIGLYFGELKEKNIRLSIEGSQIVGPHASKNVVEVNDTEVEEWIKGNDLKKEHENKAFVIIKHRQDFVGCGFHRDGNIQNFVPKNRRVHELNPDSLKVNQVSEFVVLVDKNDSVCGTMEKMQAHKEGVLHRAISVFVFNDAGQLLLHQRARGKYHWPLFWTNTCCTHPRENESYLDSAQRRLQEECGFSTELTDVFNFIYRAKFDNGLIEHELDHVFIGTYNGPIDAFNTDEVEMLKWITVDELQKDIEQQPHKYTPWFKIAFPRVLEHLSLQANK